MTALSIHPHTLLRWIIALALLFGVAIASLGISSLSTQSSPSARAITPGPEIERGVRGRHEVALTFDAGGENTSFEALLGALRKHHLHCTFFLTGKWAQRNVAGVHEILADGHEIGNHTFDHPDMTKLSDEQIASELIRADAAISSLTGRSTRPLWRPPYGASNARVLRAANNVGFRSIYWSLDSLDSDEPPKTAEFLIERIVNEGDWALDGSIILMHVGEPATAEAVPTIIDRLQARHFRIVTVTQVCDVSTNTGPANSQ